MGALVEGCSRGEPDWELEGYTHHVADVGIEADVQRVRGVPPEKLRNIVDRLAIKRMTAFEDIANVVDFFVSDRSSYVAGQVVYLGGV